MTTKGMRFTRKVLRPAKGTPMGNRRSVAVAFDPDDFARILALSQQNGVAFQEQVRRLCRVAMAKP
jgi:hypothetical protein